MKKLFLLFMFLTTSLVAQEGFVMFNMNKIEFENTGKAFAIVDEFMSPTWDALVDEGMISSYEVFTHAWGDSFNLCFVIKAESHEAFLKAWDTGITRLKEKMPDEKWAEYASYVMEHKDNLYSLRHHYDSNSKK